MALSAAVQPTIAILRRTLSPWAELGLAQGITHAGSRLSKPIATLRAPSQERTDTAGRFEQSRVFNKRYGRAGLLRFRHQQIRQGRLPRFFAFCSSLRIGDLRREDGFHFLRLWMALLERAADEQFLDLSVGQGFERLVQPDYG